MHDHDVSRLPVVAGRRCSSASSPAATSSGRSSPSRARAEGDASRVTPCRPPGPRSTSAPSPHNVAALARHVAPAAVCAVVKADGYGHGAVGGRPRRARPPGATWLAVALAEEGAALRAAGIDAPDPAAVRAAGRRRPRRRGRPASSPPSTPRPGIAALGRGRRRPATPLAGPPQGRHRHAPGRVPPGRRGSAGQGDRRRRPAAARVGVDPPRGRRRARRPVHRRAARPLSTRSLAALEAAGIDVPLRHAANSAGAIAHPDARFDLVRCGIAVYGIAPSAGAGRRRSTCGPALRLVSRGLAREGRRRRARRSATGRRYRRRAAVGHRHRAARLRRRRAAGASAAVGRRGAHRRPAPADRGHGDDGPAHGRLRRRRAGRGRRRGRAASAARATTRSPPPSGPSASAPSATRSSAASAPGCPATGPERDR